MKAQHKVIHGMDWILLRSLPYVAQHFVVMESFYMCWMGVNLMKIDEIHVEEILVQICREV